MKPVRYEVKGQDAESEGHLEQGCRLVRLDFPPLRRDTAQCVAAAFGHLIEALQ